MATIVREGRDPWWAPLAVNVLGGLFNNWQQRERNKKENAAAAEAIKQIYARPETQNDTLTPAPVQDTGQGLLNTDGWAGVFHKNENPLAQFDLGTAGLAPTIADNAPTALPINAWANALGNSGNTTGIVPPTAQTPATATALPAQGNRIPTTLDIYNVMWPLLGSKRFGMVNPDRMQSIFAPYLKANEEARQEQMRQDAADRYMNAGNDTDKLNQLYASTILGITPQALLTSGQERYKYDNPYLQQYAQNTGATTRYGTFDPRRGTFSQAGEFENELTPQQQLDHQFRMLQHEAQQAQLREQMNYNREGRDWEQGYKDKQLAFEQNQVTGTPFTGNDGYQYIMTRNGKPIKITDVSGLTPAQTKILETHENNLRRIATEKERLQIYKGQLINKGIPSDDPEMIGINKRLQEIETQEKGIKGDISNILQSVSTGQQGQTGQPTANNDTKLVGLGMDIGANMLGIETPTITTHFNAPRKKKDGTSYGHAGVDYAMPKDHPIRMADVGTTMRVTKVANEPSGYGNYVEAQGELTGADGNKHTISIRWAHMGNGTVNVTKGQEIRFGDLIGKIGNTGNSRGKNGGYHLHLETRIDGKLVDPTKFTRLIAPYIAYSKTNNPNTFTGVTPPPKATVIGRQNETTVAYRNPRTGNSMSQSEVEEFERRADNGELKYARNKEELHEYWRKNGYIPTGSYNANNTQGQGQPANGNIAPKPRNIDRDVTPDMASIQLMPPPLLGVANDPHYINVPATNTSTNFATSTPQQPTANSSITDPENEAQSKEALAALNALDVQYNTWDDIYHNRYPFPSMSNFGRV